MKIKFAFLVLLCLTMGITKTHGQQAKLDSLNAKLPQLGGCERQVTEAEIAEQYRNVGQLDTAFAIASRLGNACPEAQAQAMLVKGIIYLMTQRFDSSSYAADQADSLSLVLNDSSTMARANMIHCHISAFTEGPDQIYTKCSEAVTVYKNHLPDKYVISCEVNVVTALYTAGRYLEMEQACFDLYDRGKASGNPQAMAKARYHLASAAFENGKHQKSFDYNQEALSLSLEIQDWRLAIGCMALNQVLYSKLDKQEDIPLLLREMDTVVLRLTEDLQMWHATNWAGYYFDQQQWSKTLHYCDSVLAYEIGKTYGILYYNYALATKGKTLLKLNRFKEALPLLQEARAFYEQREIYEEYLQTLPNLIVAFAHNGMPDSVSHYTYLYQTVRDSVYSAQNQKALSDLEVQYETKEKEEELRNKEIQIEQQDKIQAQQQLVIWLVGIGLVMALVLALIAYRNARRTREANKTITQRNEQIEQKNEENEMLLKEIHHRVKNNMQIILSLLDLQAMKLDGSESAQALQTSQSRIKSMALIHEKLYQQENLSKLDFGDYLEKLINHLQQLLDTTGDAQTRVDHDSVELDIDVAIPLALIVNELVTNAFKHGRKPETQLQVQVELRHAQDGFVLYVRDNGPGLPASISGSGLGMRLTKRLLKQVGASMTTEAKEGAQFEIRFDQNVPRT